MFEDNSPAPIVKVIDFGLCAELKDGQTSSAFVGTMTYAAPEVSTGGGGDPHALLCVDKGLLRFFFSCIFRRSRSRIAAAVAAPTGASGGVVWRGVVWWQ